MCTLIAALALVLRYYQRYPLFSRSRGCFLSLQNSRVLSCSSGVSLSNSIVLPPLNAFIGVLALELDYIILYSCEYINSQNVQIYSCEYMQNVYLHE